MTSGWQQQIRPGAALREIVQQATLALVAMDSDRLEELARCCADLNRDLQIPAERADAGEQLQSSEAELRLLGRILFETRANLSIFSILDQSRSCLASDHFRSNKSQESQEPRGSTKAAERVEYGDD